MFYAQSWALTHMCLFAGRYRTGAPILFASLADGTLAVEAFRMAYGTDLNTIMRDLAAYVRAGVFRPATLPDLAGDTAGPVRAAPLTALESGLVLAELLAAAGRPEEARQACRALAAGRSADPEIAAAVAVLEWRTGGFEQARPFFERAIQLGSRDPRLYYRYAALVREAGDPQRSATLLNKALELRPNYPDAHYQLAFLLLGERAYAGALRHFAAAAPVDPDRAFSYYRGLAYAHSESGHRDEAMAAAAQASRWAGKPAEVSAAAELEAQVRRQRGMPPRLSAEGLPAAPPRAAVRLLSGILDRIECDAAGARFIVRSGGSEHSVPVDPRRAAMKGAAAGFRCGPQNARAVTIEVDIETGTAVTIDLR